MPHIFISLRFGEAIKEGGLLKQELVKHGLDVFLCAVQEGDNIARAVGENLVSCDMVVILGTATYGQETSSSYSTYQEMMYIMEQKKPFFLVKMTDQYQVKMTQFYFNSTVAYYPWMTNRQSVPSELIERILEKFKVVVPAFVPVKNSSADARDEKPKPTVDLPGSGSKIPERKEHTSSNLPSTSSGAAKAPTKTSRKITGPVPIGIDFGTCTSRIGAWIEEELTTAPVTITVEIVSDSQGNLSTPSFVSFSRMGPLLGDAAQRELSENCENTVFDITRLLGRKFSDPIVQANIKGWPFKVVPGPKDELLIDILHKGERKRFAPEEIASMILSKLKVDAAEYIGSPVNSALFSIPSNFTSLQRRALIDAAHLAGLGVARTVPQAVAAAIPYGFAMPKNEERTVIVLNFGGGNLCVSLMTIEDTIFDVKASAGDNRLGGDDFDNVLVEFFMAEFKRKYKKDMSNDSRAKSRLRAACERAKRTLSTAEETIIQIEGLFNGIDFVSSITRSRFEDLCKDLFKRIFSILETVLRDARRTKGQVDEVIMVGGSSQIPKVKQLVSEFFDKKRINTSISWDEAVVFGATAHSALMSSGVSGALSPSPKLSEMLVMQATCSSFGVEVVGGRMVTLIPRNTTTPCKRQQTLSIAVDNQPGVSIKVYEGDSTKTAENTLIGGFYLSGIPPQPKGVPQIEITFDIDGNEFLSVSAVDRATNKSIGVERINGPTRPENEERLAMALKFAQHQLQDI